MGVLLAFAGIERKIDEQHRKSIRFDKLVFMKSGETPELTKNLRMQAGRVSFTKDLGYQTGKSLRHLQQTRGMVPTGYHHH